MYTVYIISALEIQIHICGAFSHSLLSTIDISKFVYSLFQERWNRFWQEKTIVREHGEMAVCKKSEMHGQENNYFEATLLSVIVITCFPNKWGKNVLGALLYFWVFSMSVKAK